jgi:glutathione peroxidase
MFIKILIMLAMGSILTEGIHSFTINDIENQPINLSEFKGKKILIVNVASECGYTNQYKDLQTLHKQYGDKVVVLGLPCNDFGGQEPGSEKEIQEFCEMTYGITFTITEKVGIKSDIHPIYQWLTQKDKNGVSDNEVKWNFHKFLIDENGNLVKSLPSKVNPMDDEIVNWVKS